MQGKRNTYTEVKNKYCKKGVVSCKSITKLIWLDIAQQLFRNDSRNSCLKISRKTIMIKTALGLQLVAWDVAEEISSHIFLLIF